MGRIRAGLTEFDMRGTAPRPVAKRSPGMIESG